MTATTQATTPIPSGAIARVTTNTHCLGGGSLLREHERFEVEGYIAADEDEDGTAYYYGWHEAIGSVEIDADHVVMDLTPEQADARPLPTGDQIIHGIDVLV